MKPKVKTLFISQIFAINSVKYSHTSKDFQMEMFNCQQKNIVEYVDQMRKGNFLVFYQSFSTVYTNFMIRQAYKYGYHVEIHNYTNPNLHNHKSRL